MLSLGLHAPCPQDVHPGRLLLGVAEERGLADPSFTHDGEDAAAAGAGVLEQPDDHPQLTVAPAQHRPSVGRPSDAKPEPVGPD